MIKVAFRECPECQTEHASGDVEDFHKETWRCEECPTKISVEHQVMKIFGSGRKVVQMNGYQSTKE